MTFIQNWQKWLKRLTGGRQQRHGVRLQKQPTLRTQKKSRWADLFKRSNKRTANGVVLPPTDSKIAPESAEHIRNRRYRVRTQWVRNLSQQIKRVVSSTRWISALLLLMLAFFFYFTLTNPRFYLGPIEVEGTAFLTAEQLIEASGFRGKNAFAAEPYLAEEAIKKIPGVLDAQVILSWPDKTKIIVKEDWPQAIWQDRNQRYWVMHNNLLASILPKTETKLELVEIISEVIVPQFYSPLTAPSSEESLPANPGLWERIFKATKKAEPLSTMPNQAEETRYYAPADVVEGAMALKKLRLDLPPLTYKAVGGLTFDDERGWIAYFGTGDEMVMRRKNALYEIIVAQLVGQGLEIEYINVDNLDSAYYKATAIAQEEP